MAEESTTLVVRHPQMLAVDADTMPSHGEDTSVKLFKTRPVFAVLRHLLYSAIGLVDTGVEEDHERCLRDARVRAVLVHNGVCRKTAPRGRALLDDHGQAWGERVRRGGESA